MTLAVTILATITAVVILITKLIELRTAQLKFKDVTSPKEITVTAQTISKNHQIPREQSTGYLYSILFITIIIACFYTGFVTNPVGLALVVFCSIAIPLFTILPVIHSMRSVFVEFARGISDNVSRHIDLTDYLVRGRADQQQRFRTRRSIRWRGRSSLIFSVLPATDELRR